MARAVRLLAALAVTILLTLLAPPAQAHAVLEDSDPASDAILATAPESVSLRFSEPVSLLPTSLQVYGPDGERVDRGTPGHPGDAGTRVTVPVTADASGTYLVSWRVVSADSHPISGSFTFSVRSTSTAPTADTAGTDHRVAVLLGVARGLGYLGAALLIGGTAFLLVCWPAGRSRGWPRRLVLLGGVGLSLLAALALLALKGPYDAGLGLGDLGRPSLVREVLGTTYGHALLARIAVVLVAAGLVLARVRVRTAYAVAGLALAFAFAVGGHAVAREPRWLALGADAVHVLSMGLWVGGLVCLTALLSGGAPEPETRDAVRRFSRLALVSVVALVATGSYQAIEQVGSWAALRSTTYGRELIVKLAVVALVLLAAAASRAWVLRRHDRSLRLLRRSVAAETLGVLLVICVTSALVATEPAESAYRPTLGATLTLGPTTAPVEVSVTATPVGDRQVRLHVRTVDAAGRPAQPPEVRADLALPSKDVADLPVVLTPAGPGHWTALAPLPVEGTWLLTVTVRTTEVDEYDATVALPNLG